MYTPEQIQEMNKAKAQAIFNRFEPIQEELTKSQDTVTKPKEVFFTEEGLNKFKEDLFKGIDEGTVSDEDLEKAQEDLLSLKKVTRSIEGKDVEVFIQG